MEKKRELHQGDLVKISENLRAERPHPVEIYVSEAMLAYRGHICRVEREWRLPYGELALRLSADEGAFIWTERMVTLEQAATFTHEASPLDKQPDEPVPGSLKPPLGIVPQHIWLENRVTALGAAITRYAVAGYTIDQAWVEEYNKHIMTLTKMTHSIYYVNTPIANVANMKFTHDQPPAHIDFGNFDPGGSPK